MKPKLFLGASLLLASAIAVAQTTPVNGVTTFNFSNVANQGAYHEYGFSNDARAGITALNVAGWDISGYTTDVDDYVIAGENWGASSDGGFIYLASNVGGARIASMRFKATSSQLFDLRNIDIGYDREGTTPVNFTITGYLKGSAVSGASFTTATLPSFADQPNAWHRNITVPANDFTGIDEFRITSSPQVVTALDIDNLNAVNFRAALPVTFSHVSASLDTEKLNVSWQTLSETNNQYFEVQASVDAKTFTTLCTSPAKSRDGSSTAPINYSVTITTTSIVTLAGLSLVSLMSFGYPGGRKRSILIYSLVILTIIACGCSKTGIKNIDTSGKPVYIRIAQIDVDGTKAYSKLVRATRQ